MQRGETTSGVPWAVLAAAFLTLPACSADVDGYRIRENAGELHGDGGNQVGGSDGLGGGDGGASGGGRSGSGGRAIGTGAASNGGAPALAAGGAGSAGAAGSGAGGASGDGGSGNGGFQAAGGRGDGGSSAGGAGTGGQGPIGVPTQVTLTSDFLNDITAAAWNGSRFFLLQPSNRKFFAVDPKVPSVSDPLPLPGTQVAPLAFGASATSVYAVIDGKVFMVPMTGTIGTETGAGSGIASSVVGAYAAGTFLLGSTGNTALRYTDIGGSVATVPALGNIYTVATDTLGFAFTTATTSGTTIEVSQALPGNLVPNTTRCQRGNFTTRDYPVSVSGSTVAFIRVQGSTSSVLDFGTVTGGNCEVVEVPIGAPSTVATAVGLVDKEHALVIDNYSGSTGHVTIKDSQGNETAALGNVNFGTGGAPRAFVVGGRYAVLITDKKPILLSF